MANNNPANPAGPGSQPLPNAEREPDASQTNYQGPAAVGALKSVPGAGVVSASADAGPNIEQPAAPHPGKDVERPIREMPGAQRSGTTRSGVAATPHQRGPGVVDTGHDPTATEAVTGGDAGAPLSTPTNSIGPTPAGLNDPDIADPNFTAGSKDREGRT